MNVSGKSLGPTKPETAWYLWTHNNGTCNEHGILRSGFVSYGESSFTSCLFGVPTLHVFHNGRGVGFSSVLYTTVRGENLTRERNIASRNVNLRATSYGATTAMLANLENVNLQHIAKKTNEMFLWANGKNVVM